jgi:hypothetical protein
MALIFLSYRRTDAPQACRIQEWLARRLGEDALFMDVLGIPVAVDFSEHLRAQIAASKLVLAVIGRGWVERIREDGDPVRMEIETAMAAKIPVLPVLIGTTPMPGPDDLPESIRPLALQNAVTVGVLHDFHAHMQALLPRIEAILGALSRLSPLAESHVVTRACKRIVDFLRERASETPDLDRLSWWMIGAHTFGVGENLRGTLYLHRTARLAELLELHVLISVWAEEAEFEQAVTGWVMQLFERVPVLELGADQLKMRLSEEDPRAIWKMVTNEPLRLSLAYVATISAAGRG